MSRTAFAISYTGFPVLWQSKLHTEMSLSTAEAEYIDLSSDIREVICFIYLV